MDGEVEQTNKEGGGKKSKNKSSNNKSKERCMYNDRKQGCDKEGCEYQHPEQICDDYLNKKCEKPRFTCVKGHHNKSKRDSLLSAKKKSEKKTEKKNQDKVKNNETEGDTVAVGICPNWALGACPNGLSGQPRCRAGAHVPHLQGSSFQGFRQNEYLAGGPVAMAAPPGPAFYHVQQPMGSRRM